MNWQPEQVDALKVLVDDSFSAGVIADKLSQQFRIHISRNAVISKVSRMGLKLAGAWANQNTGEVRKITRRRSGFNGTGERRVSHLQARREKAIAAPPEPQLPPSEFDQAIPLAQRKQLLDLGNHDCRWGVGDPGEPGFFFCGAPEADLAAGVPYCPVHAARAFNRGVTPTDAERARRRQFAASCRRKNMPKVYVLEGLGGE